MNLLAVGIVLVVIWFLPGILEDAWHIRKRRRLIRQRLEELTRARIHRELDLTVERLAARAECQRAYPRVAGRRLRARLQS